MNIERHIIRAVVKSIPAVLPFLTGRARWIVATQPEELRFLRGRPMYADFQAKTEDALYRQVWGAIQSLYADGDSGSFIDNMASIVQEQLTKAFRAALRDSGLDADMINGDPFAGALEDMILAEYDEVDGLASDVVQTAKDGADVNKFQSRAQMWANRYNDAYNQAMLLIAKLLGDNLEWVYGDADHCETCEALNGIIASADDWIAAGVQPQQPPNDALVCGGWKCQCRLEPAFKLATPDALQKIMDAIK